jgi:hypothetical protein
MSKTAKFGKKMQGILGVKIVCCMALMNACGDFLIPKW